MKTISKVSVVVALLTITIFSCKQSASYESVAAEDSSAVESKIVSSAAKVMPAQADRKFIRTANIKCKVKDVAQSTYAIENAVAKHGGFVTYTNLQSEIIDKETTKISQDSTLETTKYTVENNLTIRVPNTKLDDVITSIAQQIDFLNSREIKADDVSLQILKNELAQVRNAKHSARLANAIDSKGTKLKDIASAEDSLESKAAEKDNTAIENLSLNDQVNLSTIVLNIYQAESIKQELRANAKESRENFGSRIIDGLKTGWYVIEGIIAFFVQLWSVILIGFLIFLGYKKYSKK